MQNYVDTLELFTRKVETFQQGLAAGAHKETKGKMIALHQAIVQSMEFYRADLRGKLEGKAMIGFDACPPDDHRAHYFKKQVMGLASQHGYAFNSFLVKCWAMIKVGICEGKEYQIIVSLHHAGYNGELFALGAFVTLDTGAGKNKGREKSPSLSREDRFEEIALSVPPLMINVQTDMVDVQSYIERVMSAALCEIAAQM